MIIGSKDPDPKEKYGCAQKHSLGSKFVSFKPKVIGSFEKSEAVKILKSYDSHSYDSYDSRKYFKIKFCFEKSDFFSVLLRVSWIRIRFRGNLSPKFI